MNLYIASLKRWFIHAFREPHTVMFISLVFTVFALPVVTIGLAASIVLILSRFSADSRKVAMKEVFRTYVRPIFKKAIIMGWGDLLLLFLSVICIVMAINPVTNPVLRVLYVLYLLFNLVLLFSAIYRYPIMVCNEDLTLKDILLKGIMFTIKNLPAVFLVVMVIITLLLLSYLIKVGIVMVFPGAAAMFTIHFYRQSLCVEGYNEETGGYMMVRR